MSTLDPIHDSETLARLRPADPEPVDAKAVRVPHGREWFAELQRRGLRLFRVRPNEKKPAIKGWQSEASSDPATLAGWLGNAGIYCGDGLMVVDLDVKHEVDGLASWAALQQQHDAAPATFTVETPSGGRHLYFRAEVPGNTASKLAPGIDTRGGGGGYVLSPGSDIGGKQYAVVDDCEIVEAPDWLLRLLAPKPKAAPSPATPAPGARKDWIGLAISGTAEGRRNADLFAALTQLRDAGEAAETVYEQAQRFADETGLPREEASATARSVMMKPAREPAQRPASPKEGGSVGLSEELRGAGFTFTKFSDTPRQAVSWLWPGYLARQTVTLFAARQGSGKTAVLCDIAARISTGRPMPDGVSNPPGRVLMLVREDSPSFTLRPRLEAAGADLGRIEWSTFAGDRGPLDLATHVNDLALRATGFDFVAIDTYAAFAPSGTDHNSGGGVRVLLDALTRLAEETGAGVLTSAHLRKSPVGDGGDPMDSVNGSVQMTGAVRIAWMMDFARGEGERWLRCVKSNLGIVDGPGYLVRLTPSGESVGVSWMRAGSGLEGEVAGLRAGKVLVGADEVGEELAALLLGAPIPSGTVADRLWVALRKKAGKRKVSKGEVGAVLTEVLATDARFEQGKAGHGSLTGLRGTLPKPPEVLARELATSNPDMTVR